MQAGWIHEGNSCLVDHEASQYSTPWGLRRAPRGPIVVEHDRVARGLVAALDHRRVALGRQSEIDAAASVTLFDADDLKHTVSPVAPRPLLDYGRSGGTLRSVPAEALPRTGVTTGPGEVGRRAATASAGSSAGPACRLREGC